MVQPTDLGVALPLAETAKEGNMGSSFDLLHVHSWDRLVSRRQFLGRAAGATAATTLVLGSDVLMPPFALADDEAATSVAPLPIPGGFVTQFGPISHHFRPARGIEASTITDFNGFVGVAEIQGAGTAGDGTHLRFGMDNRFMVGEYVGVDGQVHRGAFAEI
jgi:hypothetical protein